MKEEIIEYIGKLASKFGTTTENLWLILIKQARMTAIINLAYIVIMLCMGFGLFGIHKILSHEYPLFKMDTSVTYTYYERHTYKVIIPFIFGIIVWIIALLVGIFKIGNIVTGIYNPGYWALNDIGRRFGRE